MPKDNMLKDTTTLLSGTVLAQVFTFVITILLTQYYSPEEFGQMAFFMATALIVIELSGARYETAIMLPKEHSQAQALLGLTSLLGIGTTIITGLVVFLSSGLLAQFIETPIVDLLLWLPLAVLLGSQLQATTTYLNRSSAYKSLAMVKLMQALFQGSISLLFGILGDWGAMGFLYGYLAGGAVALLVSLIKLLPMLDRSHMHRGAMLAVAKEYSHFPRYSIGSSLLNNVSKQAPVYVLQYFFGAGVVGQFSLSYRMLATPVLLVSNSFSQIFLQRAAHLYAHSKAEFTALVKNTTRNLFLLGIAPIVFLSFFGADVFGFIFGDKWLDAGVYTQYLAPWVLLTFIVVPISLVLDITGKLKQELVYNISLFAGRTAILVAAATMLSAASTVMWFGVASAVFTVVLIAYCWYVAGVFGGRKRSSTNRLS